MRTPKSGRDAIPRNSACGRMNKGREAPFSVTIIRVVFYASENFGLIA